MEEQVIAIYATSVVAEKVYAGILATESDLGRRSRALEGITCTRQSRAWARRLLETGCAQSTDRQTPARRRGILLTNLGVIKPSHMKVTGWGVHPSVAHALRLAHATLLSFGEPAELVGCLTEKGYERMRVCVDALGRELRETIGAGDARPALGDARPAPGDATATGSTRDPDVWVVCVRGSTGSQLREPHSLRGQVVTCAWTLRHEAHRRRRAGESLRAPEELIVGVAVGSKIFPRRVNHLFVALVPGGAAFDFFVDFALARDERADDAGDASAFPLPADVAKRLASPETQRAIKRELLDAVMSVAVDASPDANAPLDVVEFGDRCAYIPGGGTNRDDSMDHLEGFGNHRMMPVLERLVARRRASEGAAPFASAGDVVVITSHHDRRPPGYVDAATPGERFRLVAVSCLASTAVVDVRPELAWGGEGGCFLDVTRGGEGAAIVQSVGTLGAVSTAEFSATVTSGDAYYDGGSEKRARELFRRSLALAKCAQRLDAWCRDGVGAATATANASMTASSKRVAVCFHRVSASWQSFATQTTRNVRVYRAVFGAQPRAHERMYLLSLDGFKGTDVVPVAANRGAGRHVHALTIERGADGAFAVEARERPQGPRRHDLGAFAVEMLERLIAREGGATVADVFIPAVSRVCLAGAVDALAELDAKGWRFYFWDLWQAAAVDDGFRRFVLRDDGSVRLDHPWVRGVLKAIALGDRLWRWVNGFARAIHV